MKQTKNIFLWQGRQATYLNVHIKCTYKYFLHSGTAGMMLAEVRTGVLCSNFRDTTLYQCCNDNMQVSYYNPVIEALTSALPPVSPPGFLFFFFPPSLLF